MEAHHGMLRCPAQFQPRLCVPQDSQSWLTDLGTPTMRGEGPRGPAGVWVGRGGILSCASAGCGPARGGVFLGKHPPPLYSISAEGLVIAVQGVR